MAFLGRRQSFKPIILHGLAGPAVLNLTSTVLAVTYLNAPKIVSRELNSALDSSSFSILSIGIKQDNYSEVNSQSNNSAEIIFNRELDSQAVSQSINLAEESISRILYSSILLAQSFAEGKFAIGAIISLESAFYSRSFSFVEVNLSKVLASTGYSLSDLIAEITADKKFDSIGLSTSNSVGSEQIDRTINAEQISQSNSRAETSIERFLTSDILAQSFAKGQFTTKLYTKFELLSYRRYSSQYFVQSGTVNDSGQ